MKEKRMRIRREKGKRYLILADFQYVSGEIAIVPVFLTATVSEPDNNSYNSINKQSKDSYLKFPCQEKNQSLHIQNSKSIKYEATDPDDSVDLGI